MSDDAAHSEFRLPDGRLAPRLFVMFVCPRCHVAEVRDAFLGVALCGCELHPRPVMVAERIVDAADVVHVPARGGRYDDGC